MKPSPLDEAPQNLSYDAWIETVHQEVRKRVGSLLYRYREEDREDLIGTVMLDVLRFWTRDKETPASVVMGAWLHRAIKYRLVDLTRVQAKHTTSPWDVDYDEARAVFCYASVPSAWERLNKWALVREAHRLGNNTPWADRALMSIVIGERKLGAEDSAFKWLFHRTLRKESGVKLRKLMRRKAPEELAAPNPAPGVDFPGAP